MDNSEKFFGPRKKMEEKKGKPGQSYPNRLLAALQKILNDPEATVAQQLQALELSIKILPLRKSPRRKTDREKLVEAVLKGKKKETPKGP